MSRFIQNHNIQSRCQYCLFLLLALVAMPVCAATLQMSKKPQVAIMVFTGDNSSSPEQLDAITERFQSELLATNQFVILDRHQIDAILKEQGFQQSGVCSSSECQVKVGQLLGVDKLITGKVVKFGDVYAFNINYLNVSTAAVEQAISLEVNGALIDVLSSGCKAAAKRLVEKTAQPVSAAPVAAAAPVIAPVTPASVVLTPPTSEESPKITAPVPALAQKSHTSRWVAIGFDALGALFVVAGVAENKHMNSKLNTYHALPADQPQAAYDAAWKDVTDARTKRNAEYVLGAALLATGITIHLVF